MKLWHIVEHIFIPLKNHLKILWSNVVALSKKILEEIECMYLENMLNKLFMNVEKRRICQILLWK